jgi:hypothetical protein
MAGWQQTSPNDDPRMNPLFWVVKETLVQHFGAKLPFKPIAEFMRSLRDANRLSISRDATRKKDLAVSWICCHWDLAKAILANLPRCEEVQSSREFRLAPSWSKMCEIERMFHDILGTKPSMKQLLDLAKQVAVLHRLRLSRDPRRNQKFLLAWYAEHWDVIEGDVIRLLGRDTIEIRPAPPIDPIPLIDPIPVIEPYWDPFREFSLTGCWNSTTGDFDDFGASIDPAVNGHFFDPDDKNQF